MTEKELDMLRNAGIDAEKAVQRLMGKEHIFLRYLQRFADDENCDHFLSSLEKKDYQEAFRAVHTLKGTAANVGVESVADIADILTEELRNGCPADPEKTENIKKNAAQLRCAFLTAQAAIRKFMPQPQ